LKLPKGVSGRFIPSFGSDFDKVPALNDRRDDIPMLILILRIRLLRSKECSQKFSSAAINLLKEYDWTGNIRELRNVVERLIILGGRNFENDVTLFASK
jgi:DNA-binding NtrC family response regulator